jgi:hypothetical protein
VALGSHRLVKEFTKTESRRKDSIKGEAMAGNYTKELYTLA